ncbi:MAG: hypothetical protein ABI443_05150 [Chthoniobacterales bacterium]
MAKHSIFFGILLILVGAGGYIASHPHAPTALIPAVIGLILVICGIVVLWNPNLRKHVMHVAALISLLGAIGSGMRAWPHVGQLLHGTAPLPLATASQTITAVLCLAFLILCIKSFIDARRAR